MKKIHPVVPLILVFIVTLLIAATPYDQIPTIFNELVPVGSKLVSQSFIRRDSGEGEMKITMINVTFTASKRYNASHTDFDSEFRFNLDELVYPEVLIQTQGKYYKMALESDIESVRKSYANRKSDPTISYDTPKETKYSWGWGITQRVHHKYMGAGSAPDDISYHGEYLGMLINGPVIKKFKFSVSGVESAQEADQWAKACAEQIMNVTPDQIQ